MKVNIAIAWFTADQWPEVQRSMTDKASETFVEWLKHATDLEAKLKKEGADVTRVPIDIGSFEIWCLRKGNSAMPRLVQSMPSKKSARADRPNSAPGRSLFTHGTRERQIRAANE